MTKLKEVTVTADEKNGGERDDFWDIEYMMPKRKPSPPSPADTSSVSLSFGDGEDNKSGEQIPPPSHRREHAKTIIDSFEKKTSEVLCEYKPDNPLFESVRICRWPASYNFYEKFIIDAQKYYRAKCGECEYVAFFSYMPQYNQLSLSQLRYYIWWRRNLRHGVFLRTDYSYIFLFYYEIINLDEVSTPEKRLAALCTVWLAYRDRFPKLDRYAGEWVCDFCLIHQLPMPAERLHDILPQIREAVTLREFYTTDEPQAPSLLSFVRANTTYSFRKSAFYEKHRSLYDTHIYKASAYALKKSQAQDTDSVTLSKTRICRDAYSGALCVCAIKRRIDIDYYSFNHSYKYRGTITALVKYAENCLRAYLEINSRLSVPSLPDMLKTGVDEYFAVYLPPRKEPPRQKTEEEIRYELYETKSTGFSAGEAAELEVSSWEFAKTLIPDEDIEQDGSEQELFSTPSGTYDELLASLSPLQYETTAYIYRGDAAGAGDVCRAAGVLLEAVIDEINSLSSDITGDILIEELEIIDDYKSELHIK